VSKPRHLAWSALGIVGGALQAAENSINVSICSRSERLWGAKVESSSRSRRDLKIFYGVKPRTATENHHFGVVRHGLVGRMKSMKAGIYNRKMKTFGFFRSSPGAKKPSSTGG
jgi:hypothetical protein